MEYRLKENIIIEDVEEVVSRVKTLCECEDVTIEKIAQFIESEYATHFYIDSKLNSFGSPDGDKDIQYLWLDTGYVSSHYNTAIFISLVKSSDGVFKGRYVGDVKCLANTASRFFPRNAKSIAMNLSKFKTKYNMKLANRKVPHLNGAVEKKEQVETTFGLHSLGMDLSSIRDSLPESVETQPEEQNNTDLKSDVTQTYGTESNSLPRPVLNISRDLWDRLLIRHWDSVEGLDYYIKICGSRIKELIDEGKTQYYILNNIKSAVINTGLLNQFGQDILVLYQYHTNLDTYCPYHIINSKIDLLSQNFPKEMVSKQLEPISFLSEEDVFDAESIDDFDINYHSLTHVLRERKDRFPDLPEQQLAEKLRNAIVLGITVNKRDKSFVKPTYSGKNGGICWYIPLHIERVFTEIPELVMVVKKRSDFYEVCTILPYDEVVKNRIRSLALYSRLW